MMNQRKRRTRKLIKRREREVHLTVVIRPLMKNQKIIKILQAQNLI
jgi:hypothetical protein